MKSIRKFAYAAVLTLSALNFAPSLASAQDDGGTFTLPHEVHWQNAIVPAGDYKFTLQSMGPSEMLKLRKISGAPASFMLLVNDTATAPQDSAPASLIINSKLGERYVSAMNLPMFEVTLHFATPANRAKEMAEMHPLSAASSAR
ncbi:MAG: hypothetical protein WB919_10695 [Candidatus Sulfotelmatobacter sp.]